MGDVVLTKEDLLQKRQFKDGCVPSTWSIDLHYPKKPVCAFDAFLSTARTIGINPYPIPYRCFYSRNVTNRMMAGRNVSVTHVALGTVRVQRTTGMMGEVVGKAAWIATTQNTTPRGVYQNYLPILIDLIKQPGRARRASIEAPLTIPDIPQGGLRVKPAKKNIITLKGIVVDDTNGLLWRRCVLVAPVH